MTPSPSNLLSPVATTAAPSAIGPYVQAVVAGGFVFTAGQLGLDPATGEMVAADPAVQARRVLDNLRAVLEAAGTDLAHVVKAGVYVVDLGHFGAINEVWATYFPTRPPARTTVQVAALPRGGLVEVDLVAVVPDAGGPA